MQPLELVSALATIFRRWLVSELLYRMHFTTPGRTPYSPRRLPSDGGVTLTPLKLVVMSAKPCWYHDPLELIYNRIGVKRFHHESGILVVEDGTEL